MSTKRNQENGRFIPDRKYAQDIDHKYVVKAYKEGKSALQIANEVNSYPRKIRKILVANGIEFRKKRCYLSGVDNPRFTGYEDMQGTFLSSIKAGAKSRGIEFLVTKEYIWNLFVAQKRKCKYTGLPIFFSRNNIEHAMGHGTASLDRIDPSKGYIEGNVQWVHKRVNIMKGNMLEQEFLDFCEAIVKQNKDQTIFKTLYSSTSHKEHIHGKS
jgi:hypothetical protein